MALGYLLAWLQPLATLAGLLLGYQWAGLFVMFAVFGLARPLVGERVGAIPLTEAAARMVHGIQWGVLVLAASTSLLAAYLLGLEQLEWDGAASVWACLTFTTPALHALAHRRGRLARQLVEIAEGALAYPLLAAEHRVHHQVSGLCDGARNPRRAESAVAFVVRRLRGAVLDGLSESAAVAARRSDERSPLARGLIGWTVGATAWMGVAAAAAELPVWTSAGLGLLAFMVLTVSVFASVQLVTYVQHWGLGDDVVPAARSRRLGWQDTCLLQRWVTFDLSLHYHHHLHPSADHNSARLLAGAPAAPASYVVLLVLALWPAAWRRVMDPVLDSWLARPNSLPELPPHRITCFRALTKPPPTRPKS